MTGGLAGGSRYSPAQLARLLRLPEPTPEQAAVISAPLAPLAVIAGAGSGKSETMAARLVWLVANGLVRPERVLGLTFTRKAAAELAERVRVRLDGLRRAQLPQLAAPALSAPALSAPGPSALPALAQPEPGGLGTAESQPQSGPLATAGTEPAAGDPVIATYHSYAGGWLPITHCARRLSRRCA